MRAPQNDEIGGSQVLAVVDVAGTEPGLADVVIVVEDGPMPAIDEGATGAEAQQRSEAIIPRSLLPDKSKYPTW